MARTRFIFVTGGVMSGIGKGVATSSIGKILQSKGYKITAIKIDPYINVDAGTISPAEHGEIFVTEDGLETDQDLGNYERFLDSNILSDNYMTTGRVYLSVITRERNLEYKGRNVEVVPDIPLEVIKRIKRVASVTKADFVLIEIGGTVGEYQNMLFLEAARMLRIEKPKDVLVFLVSYLPIPSKIGEMKTKPTQYAARSLNSMGIQPDFILCRSEVPIDEVRKNKIALFCSVPQGHVVSSPDVDSIYEIPINYEKEQLADKILAAFRISQKKNHQNCNQDMQLWEKLVTSIQGFNKVRKIGVIGKYYSGNFVITDSYISVMESIKHACWHQGYQPKIEWFSASDFASNNSFDRLKDLDAVVIPDGLESGEIEDKIAVLKFLRQNKIPTLGIGSGMQLMCIEFARHQCFLADASSMEINSRSSCPLINFIDNIQPKKHYSPQKLRELRRLGSFQTKIKEGTILYNLYNATEIAERYRHLYKFNTDFRDILESKGLVLSAVNSMGDVGAVELRTTEHPFFVGVQYHPEFKTRFMKAHPLFLALVRG